LIIDEEISAMSRGGMRKTVSISGAMSELMCRITRSYS
jgi:hypothetical protein